MEAVHRHRPQRAAAEIPRRPSCAPRGDPATPNPAAPAFGKRKAALFATCFVNYNKPETGMAARAVLNHLGVETKAAYPGCCGMPFLEQAELARVAEQAAKVSKELVKLIDEGYDIVAPHRLLRADAEIRMGADRARQRRRQARRRATFDIDEYVVDIAKKNGLPAGLKPCPKA
jgi:glycerol-3-phosphate dehydrogenase subunit C